MLFSLARSPCHFFLGSSEFSAVLRKVPERCCFAFFVDGKLWGFAWPKLRKHDCRPLAGEGSGESAHKTMSQLMAGSYYEAHGMLKAMSSYKSHQLTLSVVGAKFNLISL